ncbi:uncharacterized protein LOC135691841 isoform X2 [Rhopilema esculentum]|uniref:uncharacterized protein LOC135691841 isoform X2 n=1 Tax=Rhopilema esculentum TaxID=499914 RepID=UPI0031D92231
MMLRRGKIFGGQNILPAPMIVQPKGQNSTVNCTTSNKRQFLPSECIDVTQAVQSNQHVNRIFHPHEPYINDATPIMPIHAVDSIPWINDYQPVEPIQDDNDIDDEEDDDEEDDRRNKIRKKLHTKKNRRLRHKDILMEVHQIIDSQKAKQKFLGPNDIPVQEKEEKSKTNTKTLIKNFRKLNPNRKGQLAKNKNSRPKRNVENKMQDQQIIFPVKLGSMLKSFIKRTLVRRLRLLKLDNTKKDLIAANSFPGIFKKSLVQTDTSIKAPVASNVTSEEPIIKNLISIRGLVPMIPGKPKVEKPSLEPLKSIQQTDPQPAIPGIQQKMQKAETLEKEEIKIDKLKDLDKVPDIKLKKP